MACGIGAVLPAPHHHRLLGALAKGLADMLLGEFGADWIQAWLSGGLAPSVLDPLPRWQQATETIV
jgi:hypothetical protein